ncbi:MAG: M23 family metallopeptidase, partial [Gammaproteobacteria bacterium]|nr:M23 family metallopeptidase [Gammaproteobacteria bacterium]MCI0590218.1 M23 family metallopeptidase [Gammaproteobacteria bacterium]
MELIIISKSHGTSSRVRVGVGTMVWVMVGVLVLGVGVFYGGMRYAMEYTVGRVLGYTEEAGLAWQREVRHQRQVIEEARRGAQEDLNALALKLSELQAHVMRLDALGARLVAMANLSAEEFDFHTVPGIGGPVEVGLLTEKGMEVADFLESLESLSGQLEDRGEKLAALESLLMNRRLEAEIFPTGSPVKGGWVSSYFGRRTDPLTGRQEFHEGVDFAGRAGSQVIAVAAGIVTWSGRRYSYGNLVEVNHGNGYVTRYAHNKENLVSVGEKVGKGQVIAVLGSTGRSIGAHVHFEVLHNGKAVDP